MAVTRFFRIIFLFTVILLFSCEDNRYFTDCEDCTADEPVTTLLAGKIDPNYVSGVVVMVWEGRLEDNNLFDSSKVYTSTFERKVPLNRTYTITATYFRNNKKYIAIDSAAPRVKYTEDLCTEPCYFVYDNSCDLRLKYTK
jgi:hypothetical protein